MFRSRASEHMYFGSGHVQATEWGQTNSRYVRAGPFEIGIELSSLFTFAYVLRRDLRGSRYVTRSDESLLCQSFKSR